jgi:hypothetical protein
MKNKITAEQILTEGVRCTIALYADSEATGGEFADDLVVNMSDRFAEPLNIPIIMKAIQEFREWDFGEEDFEGFTEIQAEIEMIPTNRGYLENDFQDYMYLDGSFVPAGVRVGLEDEDKIQLDVGVNYASEARIDHSIECNLRYQLSILGMSDDEIQSAIEGNMKTLEKPEPIHIVFGETPSCYKIFNHQTEAEAKAFWDGLNAMDGYLGYRCAEDIEEYELKTLKEENEEDYNNVVKYLSRFQAQSAELKDEMVECEDCGEIGFIDSETQNFECSIKCHLTDFDKVALQEIHDWHADCEHEGCEIREAIEKGISDEELIKIAKDVDPDLFDETREVYRDTKSSIEFNLIFNEDVEEVKQSKESNYDKLYPLLENARALVYDGMVVSNWSLENIEESDFEDDENPIVLSMYHIGFDFEKSELHFDLSDVNNGVLDDNMKLTAVDGHTLEILVRLKAEPTEKLRLVQLQDDDGVIMLANTNMTEGEILKAVTDEELDADSLDYEEKLVEHTRRLNKKFERVYLDEEINV